MPLASMPTSSVGALLNTILAGDMTAAGPLLDELSESRADDARWLRERIGVLSVANYATPAASEMPGVVPRRLRAEALPNRPIRPDTWESFSRDVLSHFWLDLHTLGSTLTSLNDSLRYRAGFSVAIVNG